MLNLGAAHDGRRQSARGNGFRAAGVDEPESSRIPVHAPRTRLQLLFL